MQVDLDRKRAVVGMTTQSNWACTTHAEAVLASLATCFKSRTGLGISSGSVIVQKAQEYKSNLMKPKLFSFV
jgi:hypothetical protein